jgi:hypothetical protein
VLEERNLLIFRTQRARIVKVQYIYEKWRETGNRSKPRILKKKMGPGRPVRIVGLQKSHSCRTGGFEVVTAEEHHS